MSKKENKFTPDPGFKAAVHFNIIAIRAVAHELDMFPETLGEAMARAGFQLVVDPFNLTNDAARVIALQEKQASQGIHVVKEPSDDSDSDTSAN